ncbi:beta-glucoside-specific PTS transporter subunit IIABC [Saccharibacillus sp. JS10]|uniref:beta-glucoside-specific PTS transporter subunit IIABC n=1 Tax=Saccharibacillus sp. JS10 TaxID=2950552 RepID=UPI00210E38D0|nr:beta-glucoside-specific PTS transporter subunit IIABC [Saccharibacillus sp. JS10]MCQ4087872.1 beta-glucoside-specific PTS transporter subunit IIABC [Saccharibacillus sp. JS10]
MATSVRDYPKLAKDILEAVGGSDNIVSATRCATRLRLVLKETSPAAKEQVASMPGVITVVENGGQFQVVIGQHVGEVYDSFAGLANLEANTGDDAPKGTILNRIIATMSAVFAPFVYILAAAGILQGLLIVTNLIYPAFAETGTYEVFSFISWAPFTFLPIFIAITASKHFKTNTFIAVASCAALVTPDWAAIAARISDGENFRFIGIALTETTYTSSVLPPLFLVWILSYLEKFLNKIMHEVIRPLFVPFLCLVLMVPLTIVLIGPLSTWGANGIANGYNFLAENVPALAGAIVGGFWQVIVIFGVHWGVTPMVLANFEQYGRDSFQAYQTIAIIAQIGAVLGVIIKTRSQETRKVGVSAGITGLFGITEPAIYGITLKFKKPMLYGCLSGAIGAIVASFFNPYYFAYAGLPGPLTIVNGINEAYPTSVWGILIGCAIALVLPVLMVMFFGYGEDATEKAAAFAGGDAESGAVAANGGVTAATAPQTTNLHSNTSSSDASGIAEASVPLEDEIVMSPLKGKVLPLSEVPDEAFSTGAMGPGVAIEPEEGKLYAPFDGVVATTTPSRHAIGLQSDGGVELFVHVGMDTVKLKGEPFTLHVQEGDSFRKGDLLLEFDTDAIQAAGMPTITPVLVTNAFDYQDVTIESVSESTLSTKLLTAIR